jgi:hypothetical protein
LEGRGGEGILLVNYVCFNFSIRGEEERGGNIRPFLLPPNWGDLEGREEKTKYNLIYIYFLKES